VAGDVPDPLEEERTSYDIGDLWGEEFRPIDWVVPDIVPEGLMLLGGKPKMGKSWLVLALALACATGGQFLGHIRIPRRPVLYLALEDTPRRLRRRIDKLTQGNPPRSGIEFWTHSRRLGHGAEEDLHKWMQHNQRGLVVIDTLQQARPPLNRSSSTYEQEYQNMQGLKSLSGHHQSCILLVHHLRKLAADDVYDTILGSQGLMGSVDAMMVLTRQRGTGNGRLIVTGREIEREHNYLLLWDHDKAMWQLGEEPLNTGPKDSQYCDVIQVIEEAPGPLTTEQVMSELLTTHGQQDWLNPRDIGTILGKAAMSGDIRRVARATWASNSDNRI
jgi:hypothetical protein